MIFVQEDSFLTVRHVGSNTGRVEFRRWGGAIVAATATRTVEAATRVGRGGGGGGGRGLVTTMSGTACGGGCAEAMHMLL